MANSIRLVSTVRRQTIEGPDGSSGSVGRSHECDFPILDPSISRRHAKVSFEAGQARIQDYGSSNGTFVNGERTSEAIVKPGDTVTFGRLEFAVEQRAAVPDEPVEATAMAAAETTIMRHVSVDNFGDRQTAERSAPPVFRDEPTDPREAQLLLIEIAKEFTRHEDIDRLLERFVDLSFQVMNVDCVSLQMLDPDTNELVPRINKSRLGSGLEVRRVPTSISSRVLGERIAILTDNAAADVRFQGSSIVVQNVRSAMCTPLMARDGSVLGVFYVDNRTANRAFSDEDLSFLISFAGIAAGAIESAKATMQSELRRHFAPAVADAMVERDDSGVFPRDPQPVTVLAAQLDGLGTKARLSPAERTGYLAHYVHESAEIVFTSGAVLDRGLTGDMLAFWGLPMACPDAADRALAAAGEFQALVERLNKRWLDSSTQPVTIRIGIASGTAIGQNIGSEKSPDWTVVGAPLDQARLYCALASPGEVRQS